MNQAAPSKSMSQDNRTTSTSSDVQRQSAHDEAVASHKPARMAQEPVRTAPASDVRDGGKSKLYLAFYNWLYARFQLGEYESELDYWTGNAKAALAFRQSKAAEIAQYHTDRETKIATLQADIAALAPKQHGQDDDAAAKAYWAKKDQLQKLEQTPKEAAAETIFDGWYSAVTGWQSFSKLAVDKTQHKVDDAFDALDKALLKEIGRTPATVYLEAIGDGVRTDTLQSFPSIEVVRLAALTMALADASVWIADEAAAMAAQMAKQAGQTQEMAGFVAELNTKLKAAKQKLLDAQLQGDEAAAAQAQADVDALEQDKRGQAGYTAGDRKGTQQGRAGADHKKQTAASGIQASKHAAKAMKAAAAAEHAKGNPVQAPSEQADQHVKAADQHVDATNQQTDQHLHDSGAALIDAGHTIHENVDAGTTGDVVTETEDHAQDTGHISDEELCKLDPLNPKCSPATEKASGGGVAAGLGVAALLAALLWPKG
jgi:hypothetical protein